MAGPTDRSWDVLPVLPLAGTVVLPYASRTLTIVGQREITAVDRAIGADGYVFVVPHADAQSLPSEGAIGTIAAVNKLSSSDDGENIHLEGVGRARVVEMIEVDGLGTARVTPIDHEPAVPPLEMEATMRAIRQHLERIEVSTRTDVGGLKTVSSRIESPAQLADEVLSNVDLKPEELQRILETLDIPGRLSRALMLVSRETELLAVQEEISSAAQERMSKSERDDYLRQQLLAIQSELDEETESQETIATYRERIGDKPMPEAARSEIERQIARLERMDVDTAEAAVIRAYLEWMTTLPWRVVSTDTHDLQRARRILDEEHYGLDDVKVRILEYLAVRKLRGMHMRGQTLCLVGPAGVGKTSLGRAIARALGRRFVRFTVGGLRDEAEVRGHRRTYVGAMPGRIMQAVHQAQTSNPLLMLDEVDKIASDSRGDPSTVLLEVLDPEQNGSFVDHYLDVPYDLSTVMFIATANDADAIRPALLDRMDVIEISGYTDEDKLQIAKLHLIPRAMDENGIGRVPVVWTDEAIVRVIHGYTNEAGLRNLERVLGAICRRIALSVAEGGVEEHVLSEAAIPDYVRRVRTMS